MHSRTINKTTFHYNSDLSGEVIICVGDQEIAVSGDDLFEFIGGIAQNNEVSRIQDMTGTGFLNNKKR